VPTFGAIEDDVRAGGRGAELFGIREKERRGHARQ
jgi:hypothetical protein